jgi:hypothetical protein
MRPVLLGQAVDFVGILFGVDFLEKFEPYDAVVGCFVVGDLRGAQGWGLREDVVDAGGVEDFVYTIIVKEISILMILWR